MSHLVPLIVVGWLVYHAGRFVLRQGRLPDLESLATDLAAEMLERTETPDRPVTAVPAPVPVARVAAPSVARAAPSGSPSRTRSAPGTRYLLSSTDAPPRAKDRVARMQRRMRGRGLCSPTR